MVYLTYMISKFSRKRKPSRGRVHVWLSLHFNFTFQCESVFFHLSDFKSMPFLRISKIRDNKQPKEVCYSVSSYSMTWKRLERLRSWIIGWFSSWYFYRAKVKTIESLRYRRHEAVAQFLHRIFCSLSFKIQFSDHLLHAYASRSNLCYPYNGLCVDEIFF